MPDGAYRAEPLPLLSQAERPVTLRHIGIHHPPFWWPPAPSRGFVLTIYRGFNDFTTSLDSRLPAHRLDDTAGGVIFGLAASSPRRHTVAQASSPAQRARGRSGEMEIANRLKQIPPYLFMELRTKIARARA